MIDPSKQLCICLLHALLNITGCLVDFVIDDLPTEELAQSIIEYLRGLGIIFSHAKSKTPGRKFRDNLERKSWRGIECIKIMDNHVAFLDLAFPAGADGRNQDAKKQIAALFKEWKGLYHLITHVTDRDQGGDLNAQADAVQAAATAFGSNFLKVFQRERATLYVHMVVAHVAPLIRRWGNLVKFGGQGCVVLLFSFLRFIGSSHAVQSL